MLDSVLKKTTRDPLEKGLHTFLNPYSYVIARKNADLFKEFDGLHLDGGLLVFLVRLLAKGKDLERKSFDMTSLADLVFSKCSKENKSVFLIGGEESDITMAVSVFSENYPDLNICGYRSGFFESDSNRGKVIESIVALNPDIVVVGMGTPLQEEFLVDLSAAGWDGTGYTCGGFFHQSARGKLEYYPPWIDKFNLRWAYRMYDEPKLIKRYLKYYPLFLFVFACDVLNNNCKR